MNTFNWIYIYNDYIKTCICVCLELPKLLQWYRLVWNLWNKGPIVGLKVGQTPTTIFSPSSTNGCSKLDKKNISINSQSSYRSHIRISTSQAKWKKKKKITVVGQLKQPFSSNNEYYFHKPWHTLNLQICIAIVKEYQISKLLCPLICIVMSLSISLSF